MALSCKMPCCGFGYRGLPPDPPLKYRTRRLVDRGARLQLEESARVGCHGEEKTQAQLLLLSGLLWH